MEPALSGLMGAFEEIQTRFSGFRKNRRWYSGTGRVAKKEIAVNLISTHSLRGMGLLAARAADAGVSVKGTR